MYFFFWTNQHTNKIYNLGSGRKTSINYIASIFNGKKKFIANRPGEPKDSLANISKLKKDLKWRPKISIETGIRNQGNIEVLSGLSKGDKIIAEGLTKVRPGMKVKPIIKPQ